MENMPSSVSRCIALEERGLLDGPEELDLPLRQQRAKDARPDWLAWHAGLELRELREELRGEPRVEGRERAVDEMHDAGLARARRAVARDDLRGDRVDVGSIGDREERGRARDLRRRVCIVCGGGDVHPAQAGGGDTEGLGDSDEECSS
jgi:hypothetical protein